MFFYIIFVLLGIILALGICMYILRDSSFIKCLVFSITLFVNHYIVISGVFFALDSFSIEHILVCVIGLEAVENLFFAYRKYKKNIKYMISFSMREFGLIVIIILILFPFAVQRNGFFCMAQDEGGYYAKALYLIEEKNANVQEAKEYNLILDDEYREYFQDSILSWVVGFPNPKKDLQYTNIDLIKAQYNDYEDGLYGRSHGIYTFPAVLALFGKIVGNGNIGYIQLLFYYIYIVIIFFILQNLKIRTILREIITILCGLIPTVIWCEKSFLTEIYLCVIMSVIIFLLSEKSDRSKTFAIVYMGTLSFYHVTAFVFVPLFVLTYIFLFLMKRNDLYLKSIIGLVILYFEGFLVSLIPNPSYSVENYSGHLKFLNIYNIEALISFVFLMCILVVIAVTLFIKIKVFKRKMIYLWEKMIYPHEHIAGNTIIALLLLLNLKNIIESGNWQQNSLIAYVAFTGGAVFVFLILEVLFRKNIFEINEQLIIIRLYFIYAILLLAFVLKDIHWYYYFARYLSPYTFIIFIYSAMVFNVLNGKYYFYLLISMISMKHLIVYDSVLMKYQDDTYYQLEALQEIIDSVKEEQIIIVGDVRYHTFGALYVPLKLKDAYIFPMKDSVENTIQQINCDDKSEIIYISWEKMDDEDYDLINVVDNQVSLLKDYQDIYSDMFLKADQTELYQYYTEKIYVYQYMNGEK